MVSVMAVNTQLSSPGGGGGGGCAGTGTAHARLDRSVTAVGEGKHAAELACGSGWWQGCFRGGGEGPRGRPAGAGKQTFAGEPRLCGQACSPPSSPESLNDRSAAQRTQRRLAVGLLAGDAVDQLLGDALVPQQRAGAEPAQRHLRVSGARAVRAQAGAAVRQQPASGASVRPCSSAPRGASSRHRRGSTQHLQLPAAGVPGWGPPDPPRRTLMGVVRQEVKVSAGRSGFCGSSSASPQAHSRMQSRMGSAGAGARSASPVEGTGPGGRGGPRRVERSRVQRCMRST